MSASASAERLGPGRGHKPPYVRVTMKHELQHDLDRLLYRRRIGRFEADALALAKIGRRLDEERELLNAVIVRYHGVLALWKDAVSRLERGETISGGL